MPSWPRWRAVTPTGGELKLDIAGARREFTVWRTDACAVDKDAPAPTHLVSLWIDTTQARRREAQLHLALNQLEQQQRANDQLRRETQDQALRDNVTGLYHARALRRPAAPRGRPVDRASTASSRWSRSRSIRRPTRSSRGGDAAKQRVLEALGRLLRGNTRAMDASCRLDRKTVSRCCCRASDWPPRIRAWKGCAASARRRSSCSTAASSASPCRWAWPAFRTPPHTQEELMQACDEALAEAQRRGGNHVTLASIRFESP